MKEKNYISRFQLNNNFTRHWIFIWYSTQTYSNNKR